MSIYFQGSWPACVSAGVLLKTKARRFGINLNIYVVDKDLPEEPIQPTLVYSPLLAALGLPTSKYESSNVIITGKSTVPGKVKFGDSWYMIDRSGLGYRKETKELLRILSGTTPLDIQLRQSFLGLCQIYLYKIQEFFFY